MKKVDLHTHGTPWNQGWAGYRRIVWAGWKAGLDVIGISEHGPRFNHQVPFRSLYLSELDKYFDILEEIRLEFIGEIEVLFGLELDYNERMAEYYADLLPKLPLDYVIGSLHTVNDWIVEMPETLRASSLRRKDAYGLYEGYFAEMKDAAKTELFNFIAHPDFVKKALPHLNMVKPGGLAGIFEDAAKMLAACDVGIEINTRGKILSDVGEYYPDDEFLTACRKAGVPLTFGSDAHEPKMVANGIPEAVAHADSIGFSEYSIWRKRERYTAPLG